MSDTIIEQLADFSANTQFNRLPAEVIEECKRDVLDSMGVALAGVDQPKGRAGIECARRMGGSIGDATIIGTGEKSTVFGAAFANGELINTLDMDSVLVPGHVSPYVLPGAFAVGETRHSSGKDLIAAVAVSHEMSYRFGAAMSLTRDYKDGKVATPPVVGYTSTVFGATASAAKLKGLSADKLANALGIAAAISPVNAHRAWLMHAPATTIKYVLAGALTNAALTAAEKRFPKGTRSPDPESFMTTDELVAKFRRNADGIIAAASIDSVVDGVLNIEKVADFGTIMRQLVRQ